MNKYTLGIDEITSGVKTGLLDMSTLKLSMLKCENTKARRSNRYKSSLKTSRTQP